MTTFTNRIDTTAPVGGIDPVQGWTLLQREERDGCGFTSLDYIARGGTHDVWLDVSRFRFTPSQDRFAWLVEHGFPRREGATPWDDELIDAAIARDTAFRRGLQPKTLLPRAPAMTGEGVGAHPLVRFATLAIVALALVGICSVAFGANAGFAAVSTHEIPAPWGRR